MVKSFPLAIKKFIDDYQSQIDKLTGILEYMHGNVKVVNSNQEIKPPTEEEIKEQQEKAKNIQENLMKAKDVKEVEKN